MNKKLLIGLIVVLVLTTILVGCSSNNISTKPDNTNNVNNTSTLSDKDAVNASLNQDLLSENDNISIGDMI